MILLCCACANPINYDAEEASITKLLNDETNYAAAADSANWASCWITSEEASFMITTVDGTQNYYDFNSLASEISDSEPFELKLSRDNFNFVIGSEVAFVSFNQQDNWGGNGERMTKETRTLKKAEGHWKIVHSNVVDVSSFERPQTESFHMSYNEIPANPKTGFTNLSGLGGMSIGYVEAPSAVDFTPLFEGLPDDLCISPHWGYILEGSIRLKYGDGKEETVNAGEVFYWPAPHTAIVDENVKLIDFSPDREFVPLMDHIATKVAEQTSE
jgi:hypothetical protein